jgi:hypothetical protein
MVTLAQVKKLGYRDELYHKDLKDSKGHSVRARVNGKIQLWKTRPTEFRLPMKHGMYDTFQLTELNVDQWTLVPKHKGK